MSRIGFAVGGNKVQDIQATIQRAEELGVDAAWMTTGGARLDSLTVFAAAAGSTQKIKFGTSIVPTFPRHPLVVAQQVQVGNPDQPIGLVLGLADQDQLRIGEAASDVREQIEVDHERAQPAEETDTGLWNPGEILWLGAVLMLPVALLSGALFPFTGAALERWRHCWRS